MATRKSTLPIRKLTLPSGNQVYRVHIRRKGHADVSKNFDRYTPAKEYAEIELGKIRARSGNRQAVVDKYTIAAVIDLYLEDPQVKALKDYKGRASRLELLRPYVAKLMIAETVQGDIIDILDSYEEDFVRKHGKPPAPATVNRFVSFISVLFKWAILRRLADSNPVARIPHRKENNPRKRTYTESEWAKLLEAADDLAAKETDRPVQQLVPLFLRLAWETGARCGELLKLRWCDVTWLDDEILGADLELLDTKNSSDREVSISKDAANLLRAHQQQYGGEVVFPPQKHGVTLKMHRPFSRALKKAGLQEPDPKHGEVLTLHHIRHTWATRLGASGASLAQLMAAGGWSTPGMVARYMKRQKEQAREAALLLMGK